MKLSGPELGFSEDENIVIVDGFLNQGKNLFKAMPSFV